MSILGGIMCQDSQKEVIIIIICIAHSKFCVMSSCFPYKDADPIISEEIEKKFLAIVQYNVTEGGTLCVAQE